MCHGCKAQDTLIGKPCHVDGVVTVGLWKARRRHVTVACGAERWNEKKSLERKVQRCRKESAICVPHTNSLNLHEKNKTRVKCKQMYHHQARVALEAHSPFFLTLKTRKDAAILQKCRGKMMCERTVGDGSRICECCSTMQNERTCQRHDTPSPTI